MSVSAQDQSWDTNRKKGYITRQLTATIEREGDGFVALCPEVDVASQDKSVDESQSLNNHNDDSPWANTQPATQKSENIVETFTFSILH
jgi:hypothetical protein